MKHFKDLFPIALLMVLAPYFFYSGASIAQSIITASIAALVGFKYYLEHNSQPDYEKIFRENINQNTEATTKALEHLQKEIDKLKEKQGAINISEFQQKRAKTIW